MKDQAGTFYYNLAVRSPAVPLLTYKSDRKLSPGQLAEVNLKNKQNQLAVVIESSLPPESKRIQNINLAHETYIAPWQVNFIAKFCNYYDCQPGDVVRLLLPRSILKSQTGGGKSI